MFWIKECPLRNFNGEQNEQKNVNEHATDCKSYLPRARAKR